MTEQPEQPEPTPPPASPPPLSITNLAPNLGAQGIFHDQVQITQLPPPPMPVGQALALLAELPLGDVPAPQTLPDPHRMPFTPNPLFVGRADDLGRIAARLKAGGTIAVTTGIGGVGKTQLASEAAHRYGRYFGGGVFWLSFAEPSNIALEIADCGRRMGAFHDAEKLELDAQVQRTLARWATDLPRLLIFDNCEDEALLRRWQPRTGGCRVLVTSRKQSDWSPDLGVALLPLDVLARAESVRLLQRLAPRLTAEEADQIAAALGDLPLALHLAGRYLARYRLPVADYLAKLAGAQLKHPALQGKAVERLPTDREPHVERVFAISFERLSAADPTDDLARQLLARAACFAPGEPFRREWLEQTVTPEGDEEEQLVARTDALERLLGLGLLELVGEDMLRLHRLLVAYAAQRLSDADAWPSVEQVICDVATQANLTKVPQIMWPVLPHLRHCAQQPVAPERAKEEMLFTNLGYYFYLMGNYTDALPLLERALAITEQVWGADHHRTAFAMLLVAKVHEAQGAYAKARSLLERALIITEQALGSDHLYTTTNLSNLASLYATQGDYEAAQALHTRALAIREQALEPDHPDIAESLNSLALLYFSQGKYEAAKSLQERALSLTEKVLGPDHPDTVTMLNNLAMLYEKQGAYDRAKRLVERVVAIRKQVLGAEHPDTVRSLSNLAAVHHAQGAYDVALPLLERVLDVRKRLLGTDHPDTATSLNNLAHLYKIQGSYDLAHPLLEQALTIRERLLGAEHPDTAASLNNLAELYRIQGAFDLSRPLQERALAIRGRILGPDHPDTAESLNNLALLYAAQGSYHTALPLAEQVCAIFKRTLGTYHPLTATSLNNLAKLYADQGAQEQAIALYEQALDIQEQVLGPDHLDVAASLYNLAEYYGGLGRYQLALPLLERASAIRQTRLGPEHPSTQQAQEELASLNRLIRITDVPKPILAALQTGDGEVLQQALKTLPPEEAQVVFKRIMLTTGMGPSLEQLTPVLQAIAAVARGDDGRRAKVEAALERLEQLGLHLSAAVQAIWNGQRDPKLLTSGLDEADSTLIQRVLALIAQTQQPNNQ